MQEAIDHIEYRLKCERNGWKTIAIIACAEDWPVQELAEKYNATIVDGRHAHGGHIFLRVPVVRPPTIADECIKLLRANRERHQS